LSAPTDNQIYALAANQFSPSPGTTLVRVARKSHFDLDSCPGATRVVTQDNQDVGGNNGKNVAFLLPGELRFIFMGNPNVVVWWLHHSH